MAIRARSDHSRRRARRYSAIFPRAALQTARNVLYTQVLFRPARISQCAADRKRQSGCVGAVLGERRTRVVPGGSQGDRNGSWYACEVAVSPRKV